MEKLFGPIGTIITDVFWGAIEFVKNLFDDLINGIKRVYDGIIKITKGDLWGGLKDIFGGLLDILTAPFKAFIDTIKGLWDKIKEPLSNLIKKIKDFFNFNVKFSAGGGGAGSYGGGGSGGGFRGAKGLMYLPKFTPLAKGGIVNNPGRGVFYRGATIGEQRPEAVVPLTDTQQMELLGETIGKYINLNATIPVYVGNRQVAREIKRINLENEFAGNR